MVVSNRNLLFQGSIFRCYVSFREGSCQPPERLFVPNSSQLIFKKGGLGTWEAILMLFGDITSSVVALGIECFMLFNWKQHGNLTNKPAKPRPAKLRWTIFCHEKLKRLESCGLASWKCSNNNHCSFRREQSPPFSNQIFDKEKTRGCLWVSGLYYKNDEALKTLMVIKLYASKFPPNDSLKSLFTRPKKGLL